MSTIPFNDVVDWQPLPIDAQDIVTKVRLVIAGNRAGVDTQGPRITKQDGTWEPPSAHVEEVGYYPVPVVFEYEAPEHAIYGVTRSMALPTGVNPFLPPADPLIPEPVVLRFDNPGMPSVVRDGDPLTAAEFTGTTGELGWISYLPEPGVRYVGFRLRYTLATTLAPEQRGVNVGIYHTVHAQPPRDNTDWYAAYTYVDRIRDAESAEIYCLVPESAQWLAVNAPFPLDAPEFRLQLTVPAEVEASQCTVTDFYPLVLNEALLLGIARAQIRVPSMTPRRVVVDGVLPPTDREHTIVGWPGGDFTGVVARQTYKDGTTTIDFEQAGAPPGLPQEALEAERVRVARTRVTVDMANYNLKMGVRG